MNNENKESAGKKFARTFFTVIIAAVLTLFVYVVMNY